MSKKTYVVWDGYEPGVYDTWDECKAQVNGYSGAKYKSYPTREEAIEAFMTGPEYDTQKTSGKPKEKKSEKSNKKTAEPISEALSVDGACSGNPGLGEFQCVHVGTGEQVFIQSEFEKTTNNIMEFLALVQAIKHVHEKGLSLPIYSDSVTAMAWVRDKQCKSSLKETAENFDSFAMIKKAEEWLRKTKHSVVVLKWETKEWGEIPADFGRK